MQKKSKYVTFLEQEANMEGEATREEIPSVREVRQEVMEGGR